MKETLQQKADKEGVTRQAIWARGEKGKAYQKTDAYKAYRKAYRKTDAYKAYQKTDAYKAYRKAYQKAYQKTDAFKNYQRDYYLKVSKPRLIAKGKLKKI